MDKRTSRTLSGALQERVRGEVRFDEGSRALYATDASNYRQVPIGVVVPRDEDDVVRTLAVCREFGAPVLARGAGTSLAGQCCNVAVVLDFTRYMDRILELNADEKYAWVQPGVINDSLRRTALAYGLTFGPDPATQNRCTIGGNIGNNSCGVHSVMAGKTSDNIDELEVITYEGHQFRVGHTSEQELAKTIRAGGPRGEIYAKLRDLRDRHADQIRQKYPRIPRRVSGYNLDKLLPEADFHLAQALVGTEGTCVTVLAARCRLIPNPPARVLVVLAYPDIYAAGDDVPEILAHGPMGLEGLDDNILRAMELKDLHPRERTLLPGGGGWLLVEFGGGSQQEASDKTRELVEALRRQSHPPAFSLFENRNEQEMVWRVRRSALGASAQVPGEKETCEGWEDAAVPPDRVGPYLRDFRRLLDRYGYRSSTYGHFGDGCLHTRIDFDLKTKEGIAHFRSFVSNAVDLVLSYGGSLSGEHGQARGEFLSRMFGSELVDAFREFKRIWDPQWKMNPGKVVDAYQIDENLRYGKDYDPPEFKTHFQFASDHHGFAHAMDRCVGVGECRRLEHGTMCPSFMVTRDEKHSTRGRARLLFEMLRGDPLKGGWKNEQVREALDLCLACKGCKADCPVNVDMATYKAEFLSHYYERRPRPRSAYASGLIYRWARWASYAPELANLFTQSPGLGALAKWAAGYSQKRRIPPFALETFKQWFERRTAHNAGRPRVILWADTFNNYFHPEVAKAAVEVLEHAGFQVEVPRPNLCCGRPLYDYGMLGTARTLLLELLEVLRPQIREGIPVVGLEPSCVSVFRDEMTDLLHGNEDARRLKQQTWMLSDFLERKANGYQPPRLHRKAVVQAHCHHQAIMKFTDEEKILDKAGLDYQVLDSGCCGMAGAFGYEKGDHFEVSLACGERVLLPSVRSAPKETLIIADGFSCREQISQATNRQALHLAQVLQMGIHEQNGEVTAQEYRERGYPARDGATRQERSGVRKAVLLGAAALLASGALVWQLRRRWRRGRAVGAIAPRPRTG